MILKKSIMFLVFSMLWSNVFLFSMEEKPAPPAYFAQILEIAEQNNSRLYNYLSNFKIDQSPKYLRDIMKIAQDHNPQLLDYLLKFEAFEKEELAKSSKANSESLVRAIKHKKLSEVKEILKDAPHLNANKLRDNLLLKAVEYDAVDIARFLIDQGADVNLKDDVYHQAFILQAIKSPEMVQLMIDHGGANWDLAKDHRGLNILMQFMSKRDIKLEKRISMMKLVAPFVDINERGIFPATDGVERSSLEWVEKYGKSFKEEALIDVLKQLGARE